METWDSPWLPCISMLFDDRGKQTEAASRSKKKGKRGGMRIRLRGLLPSSAMLLLGVLPGFTLNYHNPLFCRFLL